MKGLEEREVSLKFAGTTKTVISSAAKFASIGCARDLAVLEEGRRRMTILSVGLVQVRKQRQTRIV